MRKACVIGWPIAHSRSPLIHGHWLKELGIDGSYGRVPVEPGAVDGFLNGLAANGYAGCNVTLPHKEAAFAAVTVADAATRRLGVVNTVYLHDGRLMGTSTDGPGFLASVAAAAPHWTPADKTIVMIGAGGAARAVAGTLVERGAAKIAVANRTLENAMRLRESFGASIAPISLEDVGENLAEADLVVNATSLGMAGQAALDIDLSRLNPEAIAADLVYVPLETAFLKAARARGNPVVPGLGMLLHQAVRGFELWFGARPEVTQALYDVVARDIDPDYRAR